MSLEPRTPEVSFELKGRVSIRGQDIGGVVG